jgi:aspartate aminotransferase
MTNAIASRRFIPHLQASPRSIPIFTNAGLEVRKYRYYDNDSCSLDFSNLIDDMRAMPEGSCILLHACAHNPTGMDPTVDQWKEVSDVAREKNLLPFFDSAYQGFASGDARKDASAVRMFVEDGHNIAVVQSFSKNFGLYGQRVGALSVVAADPEEASRVLSQLKVHIRPSYSNPPRHGARIVAKILADPEKTNDFVDQCMGMAKRIDGMRHELRQALEGLGSSRSWDHVTRQIGMFAYSGLRKDQVVALREKHHIYCTLDGRISMAVRNLSVVHYFFKSRYLFNVNLNPPLR